MFSIKTCQSEPEIPIPGSRDKDNLAEQTERNTANR